jgi:hypothetical protein
VQSTAWGLVSGAGASTTLARLCGCTGTDTRTLAFTGAIRAGEGFTGLDGTGAGADLPDDIWQHEPLGGAALIRSLIWESRAIIGQP